MRRPGRRIARPARSCLVRCLRVPRWRVSILSHDLGVNVAYAHAELYRYLVARLGVLPSSLNVFGLESVYGSSRQRERQAIKSVAIRSTGSSDVEGVRLEPAQYPPVEFGVGVRMHQGVHGDRVDVARDPLDRLVIIDGRTAASRSQDVHGFLAEP